jgi:hypothetical protein
MEGKFTGKRAEGKTAGEENGLDIGKREIRLKAR